MKPSLWSFIWAELLPFKGRLAMTWRTAAVCALAALLFMNYEVPLVAIGCYLVMFLAKPTAQENVLVAIAISILISVVVLLLFTLTRIALEVPMWRMVIIALGSYLFIYIGAASMLGPAGNIVALVIGFVMTLLPFVVIGEVATRGILFAWLMVLIPMGVIIVFHTVAGTSSVTVLTRDLASRLRLLATSLNSGETQTELLSELRKGPGELEGHLKMIRLFHLLPKAQSAALQAAISHSQALLVKIAALQSNQAALHSQHSLRSSGSNTINATHLNQLAALLEQGKLVTAIQTNYQIASLDPTPTDLQAHIQNLFHPLPSTPAKSKSSKKSATKLPESPSSGFFKPDAWSNPEYSRFAIKTTAAAMLAYLIYTSIQWDGIHTAMITCYVAALGSTGETIHKLTLRIIGCLIGASMGILSLAFIMPHMTSIGELVVLVFAGIMVAAWVSSGSERIAYAGIQVGLAFLMTVLQDFKPDVQMSVATDRIYGILLGNALLFITFTQLWPISVASTVRKNICTSRQWLCLLLTAQEKDRRVTDTWINKTLVELGHAREALLYNRFEPTSIRSPAVRVQGLREQINQLEQIALTFSLLDPVSDRYQQEVQNIQFQLREFEQESQNQPVSHPQPLKY